MAKRLTDLLPTYLISHRATAESRVATAERRELTLTGVVCAFPLVLTTAPHRIVLPGVRGPVLYFCGS